MTDRRPPKEAAHDTDSNPADEGQPGQSEGKRSQTLPAGASGGRAGAASAPRSTFAGGQAEPQRPARPEAGPAQAARSVFQPPADPDKTVKRPYPNQNAWGATLLVGNAVPPPDGSRPLTDTETTVVSEFPPPAVVGQAGAAPALAEPLRVPSNRPAPTPFQQTRAARSGTLLMPGIAADEFAAHAPKPPEAPARPPASPRPNPPPSASAARAKPSADALRGGASDVTAPALRGGASEGAPMPKSTSTAPVHRTEPLHLSLDARDMVPKATTSARPGIPRSRAPLFILVAGISVLVLIAGLAWSRHTAKVADVPAPAAVEDGLRSSAVPATPTAAPALPTAAAMPAAPSTTAAAPTGVAAAQKPAAAAPAAEHEALAAKPSAAAATEQKPAAAKPSQHQAAPKAHAAAAKVPSESSESIENAREALKALESPPVVRMKRKADDEERAPSGDQGTPPAPPPLPDPEGE